MQRLRDPQRCRRIVRQASQKTEINEARSWLFNDERGTWEIRADEAIEATNERARALGMTEDGQDDEIASHLAFLAVSAILKSRKG